MSVKLEPVSVIEVNLGLEPYGDAHRHFAERCQERMNSKYVPEKNGILDKIDQSKIDEECNIHYDEEYAGYQYYGQRRDGSHKVEHYTKEEARPYQGPFWDQLMMSAEKDELVKDMQNYINQRGRIK